MHIKHARFGSVDRESNYLVRSCGPARGRVGLLQDSDQVKRDLDRRTAASARFAILVLHPEQKAEVRKYFRTPLVFSIHEAKGLEYENVLLYGFISGEEKRFRDIAGDLGEADLQGELRYARGRDKGDKSLEIYKFYINALYVAVTRAVKNLYLIEPRPKQHLLALLGLTDIHEGVEDVEEQTLQPGRMAPRGPPTGAAGQGRTGRRDPRADPQAAHRTLDRAARRRAGGAGRQGAGQAGEKGQHRADGVCPGLSRPAPAEQPGPGRLQDRQAAGQGHAGAGEEALPALQPEAPRRRAARRWTNTASTSATSSVRPR